MELAPIAQWFAFGVFAFIALAGALGMTTTMSMFRSGIFLMASFIGVAGLFILLLADLLALLQVMMYIGGMLVMILFMLLFSNDPGGAMMSSHMKLMGPERWFSLGLAHHKGSGGGSSGGGGNHQGHEGGEHEGNQAQGQDHHQKQNGGKDQGQEQAGHSGGGHSGEHSGGGGHSDMSMFTSIKRPAAVLSAAVGALLVALLLWRPGWALVPPEVLPDQDSPRRIGHLLMGKYMIAFEGAGLLILLGIFGAVLVQRPGKHPDSPRRDRLDAAVNETPAAVAADALVPLVADLRDHDDEARGESEHSGHQENHADHERHDGHEPEGGRA